MSSADDAGEEDADEDDAAEENVGEEDTAADAAAAFQAELAEYPLFEFLDVGVEVVERGRVVLTVPFGDHLVNVSGRDVHGGVTATVIDTASGMALRSTFDDPGDANLTTTDMNVRYLRPARGDLRVEAETVRAGESMGVTEATATTVHEGERTVVATGGTTYRLFRGDGDG